MMKKNKKRTILFFGGIIFIAGLADLKYKGKLYQMLPASIQNCVDKTIN